MSLKSRIRTAIWARLAASATSVKSLRKASVEADWSCLGAGGETFCDGDCLVVAVKELKEVCWLVDAVGDEIGAFILTVVRGFPLQEGASVWFKPVDSSRSR
jgi:hypothetical protein